MVGMVGFVWGVFLWLMREFYFLVLFFAFGLVSGFICVFSFFQFFLLERGREIVCGVGICLQNVYPYVSLYTIIGIKGFRKKLEMVWIFNFLLIFIYILSHFFFFSFCHLFSFFSINFL